MASLQKAVPSERLILRSFSCRRDISLYFDGFCISWRDCASRKSTHHLDNNNNARMGSWPDDANRCRSNCTHSHLIYRPFLGTDFMRTDPCDDARGGHQPQGTISAFRGRPEVISA